MSSIFEGLFGPTTQDILTQRQDNLDTQLAGMSNPYERLGMLLGTALQGRTKNTEAFQQAKAIEDEQAAIGNDPMARAKYIRDAIAQGRIPADKLKQAQQAIEALDPTTGTDPLTPKELADMYAAYTDESVRKFLTSGDANDLTPQGNNKVARSVIEGDADWKAFEGAELQLGDKFYDDLLMNIGDRRFADIGEDNRLPAVKAAVYNLANQLRFNAEQPMTLAESLKAAKEKMISDSRNDKYSFLEGSTSGGMGANGGANSSSPNAFGIGEQSVAVDADGNPLTIEPPPVIQGDDLARTPETIEQELTKLKAKLKAASGREERAKIQKEISKLNKEKRMGKVEAGQSSRRGRNKTR